MKLTIFLLIAIAYLGGLGAIILAMEHQYQEADHRAAGAIRALANDTEAPKR